MAAAKTQLGPGTLTLGEVGSPIDFSCQINSPRSSGRRTRTTTRPCCAATSSPARRPTPRRSPATCSRTSTTQPGSSRTRGRRRAQDAVQVRAEHGRRATVSGDLVVDPITVGGDEIKANMTRDFEWNIVGEPTLTIGGVLLTAGATADEVEVYEAETVAA